MVEFGFGPASLPFHRFGSGDQRLVLVPGVMDALGWNTPRRLTAELLARYYFRAYRDYEVWVLSRPPGLPPDATVADLADQYEDAIDVLDPHAIMGMSLGGYIGSHLAQRFDAINRLVLVGCGSNLGVYGRETLERWRQLAADGSYARLHRSYSRAVYAGWRRTVVPPLYRVGARWLPTPVEQGDVATSCGALLDFESESVFPSVETPTLVVGGHDDSLVPLESQRTAAEQLPNGQHKAFPGGHAVYEESRNAVASSVLAFLDS